MDCLNSGSRPFPDSGALSEPSAISYQPYALIGSNQLPVPVSCHLLLSSSSAFLTLFPLGELLPCSESHGSLHGLRRYFIFLGSWYTMR